MWQRFDVEVSEQAHGSVSTAGTKDDLRFLDP